MERERYTVPFSAVDVIRLLQKMSKSNILFDDFTNDEPALMIKSQVNPNRWVYDGDVALLERTNGWIEIREGAIKSAPINLKAGSSFETEIETIVEQSWMVQIISTGSLSKEALVSFKRSGNDLAVRLGDVSRLYSTPERGNYRIRVEFGIDRSTLYINNKSYNVGGTLPEGTYQALFINWLRVDYCFICE